MNRSRKIIIAVIVVIVAVVAGVIAYLALAKDSPDTSAKPGATSSASSTGDATSNPGVKIAETDGGIPVGSQGAGSVNEGKPRLEMFFDFTCSHCGEFERTHADEMKTIAQDGIATVVYHPMPGMDGSGNYSGYSSRALVALAKVADLDPEHYMDAQLALFARYDEARHSTKVEPTNEEIGEALAKAGIKADVAASAVDEGYIPYLETAIATMKDKKIESFPTIMVNGKQWDGWMQGDDITEYLKSLG